MPLPANVENLLKQCDAGVAALKIFTDNKIDVQTTTEGAIAFFDPSGGAGKLKVVLNTSKPAAIVAAYFCHEMNHAQMYVGKTTADAMKDDVDTYVEKMVQEEADGTAIGFRCYLELERKGLATGVAPDRYDFYKRAFESGRKKATSGVDPDTAGFANGAKMARALINERFLGPNSIESYADYYRRDWHMLRRKK